LITQEANRDYQSKTSIEYCAWFESPAQAIFESSESKKYRTVVFFHGTLFMRESYHYAIRSRGTEEVKSPLAPT
jgi:hypothetical protein